MVRVEHLTARTAATKAMQTVRLLMTMALATMVRAAQTPP
jgi:hypothetical protein